MPFDAENPTVFQAPSWPLPAFQTNNRQISEIHQILYLLKLIGLSKVCTFKGKYEINGHDSNIIINFLLFSLVRVVFAYFQSFCVHG